MSTAVGVALLASDAAFGIVFGVFVLALVVLAFFSIRWAVRRDRPGRQAWRQRMEERGPPGAQGWPTTNGRGRPPGARQPEGHPHHEPGKS